MAKSTINNFGFLAYAICFLSLICLAYGDAPFTVEGKVYCDNCRVQFITKISTFIQGATVKLECKEREGGGAVTFSKEATTDQNGHYEIPVDGDHEEEICEVFPLKSPQADCNEIKTEKFNKNARVSLTSHNGIASGRREANPIGFLKKERNIECVEVLREMGITSAGLV